MCDNDEVAEISTRGVSSTSPFPGYYVRIYGISQKSEVRYVDISQRRQRRIGPRLQLTCTAERELVVGFCGQPHYCYRPYYPTARFRSPGQVKAHVVLSCTNWVSPNHLPVIVASDMA